jgi:hypothetical protein
MGEENFGCGNHHMPNQIQLPLAVAVLLHCVISIAGSDLYLAGRREARLSLDADLGLKIMAFDWREMLISIFARAEAS